MKSESGISFSFFDKQRKEENEPTRSGLSHKMRVLPLGIAILLCISAIYCAPESESNDDSILRTLASLDDVEPMEFLKNLLKMRKSGGFDNRQPISQLILSRSDIPDDIYRAMIQVLMETRKELRAGDSSLTTLNSLIWLNTHDGQNEILDLTDAILRGVHSPKAAAFSIQDLAKDMAMRRLPRQRNPVKGSQRNKRDSQEKRQEEPKSTIQNEPLIDELFEMKQDLQLKLGDAIPEISELEKKVVDEKIRNLFTFFLNKIQREMLNGSVSSSASIDSLFYENTEAMLRQSGFTLVNNGLENMEKWRVAQRSPIREVFIKAIQMIHQKANLTYPLPELRFSEEDFLAAIRESVPNNLESYEPDQLFQLIYVIAGNLTRDLRKATNLEYPELDKEIERNITRLQDEYLFKLDNPKYLSLYNPHTGRPVVQQEELDELFRMGVEQIVEAVRERYRATKTEEPTPVAGEVEEFIKDWYRKKKLEASYKPKIGSQIAWTREKLGDYQFQLLGTEFFEKTMEWKTSRVESEDWMKILRLSNGEDLVDLLREFKKIIITLLNLHPDQYNFIENFERTEVDRDETVRLVNAFHGLMGPLKSSESIARLLHDVSSAESKADFTRILHVHTIFHDWDPEVLHTGLQNIEAMKKTVKNPRKFTEFLRNVATLVATKKMEKEHLYHLLAVITSSKTSLELQHTLVSLARLLHVFDTQTVMNNVQKPSEDPEVLAAYEVLTRNGGTNMDFVRSYMRKYENETEVVRKILKELGVDPDSIKKHNQITASMDVLIELMKAARTYPNLQRLLGAAKDLSEEQIQKIIESTSRVTDAPRATDASVDPKVTESSPRATIAPIAPKGTQNAPRATDAPIAPRTSDASVAPTLEAVGFTIEVTQPTTFDFGFEEDSEDPEDASSATETPEIDLEDFTWGPGEFTVEPDTDRIPDEWYELPISNTPSSEKVHKRSYEHKLFEEHNKEHGKKPSNYHHKLADDHEETMPKYQHKLAAKQDAPLRKPGHHHFHISQSTFQNKGHHQIKKRSMRLTGLDDPNKLDLEVKDVHQE